MIRQYWWGVENGKIKMAWVAWDKLTLPKSKGGIGFRDMRAFNQALLAKQAWRLLISPDSLCARLLRAKYYPNGNLVDMVFPSNSSAVWKGIEYGLELVGKKVCSGVSAIVQIFVFGGTLGSHVVHRTHPSFPKRNCHLNRVSDFHDGRGSWKLDLLQQHFC